jgi:hypothetical protein
MAGVTNTIHELNSQRIQILERKQQNAAGANTQLGKIINIRAERFQTLNRGEAYIQMKNQSIDAMKQRRDAAQAEIAEWSALLDDTEKQTTDWYEIRQKIWDAEAEIEQSKNDILSTQIDIDKAKSDLIAADLQRANASSQHEYSMQEIRGGMYQSTGQYDLYRDALEIEKTDLTEQRGNIAEAREKELKRVKNLQASIDEELAKPKKKRNTEKLSKWSVMLDNRMQNLRQIELEYAQNENDLLTNRQSIEESYLLEINKEYEAKEKAYEHAKKMSDLLQKELEDEGDFYNLERKNAADRVQTADELSMLQEKLEDLVEGQNKVTEGSPAWYEFQDNIDATKEKVEELKQSLTDLGKQELNNIIKKYKEGTQAIYQTNFNGQEFASSDISKIRDKMNAYVKETNEANYAAVEAEENGKVAAAEEELAAKQSAYDEKKTAYDNADAAEDAAFDKMVSLREKYNAEKL